MTEQPSHRRGFIKGIVAGIAGAFFALRGAEPVEAATSTVGWLTISVADSVITGTDAGRLAAMAGLAISANSAQLVRLVGPNLSCVCLRYSDSKRVVRAGVLLR